MSSILDILSWIFLLGGGFLGVTGALGLFRFPDFYTRLHAASVTDTLCAGLIVLGLLLQATSVMMVFKLLLILLVLTYTSPTGAHALAKAARHGGLKPLTDSDTDELQPSTPQPDPSQPDASQPGAPQSGTAKSEQSQGESPSTR